MGTVDTVRIGQKAFGRVAECAVAQISRHLLPHAPDFPHAASSKLEEFIIFL